MRDRRKWLKALLGVVTCLALAVAVERDVRAEGERPQSPYRVCTEDTKIYVEPDWQGEVAASLPRDGVIEVVGDSGDYTKVIYNGVEGYIDARFVAYNEQIVTAYEEAQRLAAEREAQRIAAELEAQRLAAELEAQRIAMELIARSEEIRIMAAMIQCEAGNQPFEGQVAVGAVIMNRVKSPAYPNTILEVIVQPHQFSPADDAMFAELLTNDTIKQSCRDAALQAFLGVDNVGGAMHFRRAGKKEGLVIGNHVFY